MTSNPILMAGDTTALIPSQGVSRPIGVVDLASRTLQGLVFAPGYRSIDLVAVHPGGATAWVGSRGWPPNPRDPDSTGEPTVIWSLDPGTLTLDAGVTVEEPLFSGIGVVSPDGMRLYATCPERGEIEVYSLPDRLRASSVRLVGRDLNVLMAMTSDGKRLFVPGASQPTIAVVDTDPASATVHTLVGLVRVGSPTVQVDFSEDNRLGFASLPLADEVVVFDPGSLEDSPAFIDLGGMPAHVAALPGRAFVTAVVAAADGGSAIVGRIVEPSGGAAPLVRVLAEGYATSAGAAALGDRGEFVAAVRVEGPGVEVHVIDPVTAEERARVAVPGAEHRVVAASDGTCAFIVKNTSVPGGGYGVEVFDGATREVTAWGEAPGHALPDSVEVAGGRLYLEKIVEVVDPATGKVIEKTSWIDVWETASGTLLRSVANTERYYGLEVVPGGTRAYALRAWNRMIDLVDLGTLAVVERLTVSATPTCMELTSDGRRLVVVEVVETWSGLRSSDLLRVVDVEEGSPTRHTLLKEIDLGGMAVGMALDPDGTRAYVALNSTVQALLVVDLTATGGAGVPPAPAGPIASFGMGAMAAPGYESAFSAGPPPVIRGGAPFTLAVRGADANGRLAALPGSSSVVVFSVAYPGPSTPDFRLAGAAGALDGALFRMEPSQRGALLLPGLSFGTQGDCPVTLTVAQAFQPVPPGPAGSVTVMVDNTPPSPAVITAPASGLVTPNYLVRLEGTSEPNATLEVYDEFEGFNSLVGTAVAADTGAFAHDLTLSQGTHTITAVATDAVGNVGQASQPALTVTVRLDPPVLTSPADGFATNAYILTVAGTTTPNGFVEILDSPGGAGVPPAPVGFAIADDTGHFTAGLFLQDGLHSLTAVATDPMGNVGPASSPALTGLVDRDPPSLSFFGLENGTRLGTRTPAIFVTLSDAASGIDPSTVTLSAFGLADWTSLDLTPYLQFSPLPPEEVPGVRGTAVLPQGVLLPEGEVNLTLSGRDLAGNESGASVGIVIDDTPPEVISILPADQDLLADFANATIRVEYADGPTFFAAGVSASSVRIRLNGEDVTWMFTVSDTEAVFENANNAALAGVVLEGANAVTISVADQVGNLGSATATWQVHLDWIAEDPFALVTGQINARLALLGAGADALYPNPLTSPEDVQDALDAVIPSFVDPETGEYWTPESARSRILGRSGWASSGSSNVTDWITDWMRMLDSLVWSKVGLDGRPRLAFTGMDDRVRWPHDQDWPSVRGEAIRRCQANPQEAYQGEAVAAATASMYHTEYFNTLPPYLPPVLHSYGAVATESRVRYAFPTTPLTPDPVEHPVLFARWHVKGHGGVRDGKQETADTWSEGWLGRTATASISGIKAGIPLPHVPFGNVPDDPPAYRPTPEYWVDAATIPSPGDEFTVTIDGAMAPAGAMPLQHNVIDPLFPSLEAGGGSFMAYYVPDVEFVYMIPPGTPPPPIPPPPPPQIPPPPPPILYRFLPVDVTIEGPDECCFEGGADFDAEGLPPGGTYEMKAKLLETGEERTMPGALTTIPIPNQPGETRTVYRAHLQPWEPGGYEIRVDYIFGTETDHDTTNTTAIHVGFDPITIINSAGQPVRATIPLLGDFIAPWDLKTEGTGSTVRIFVQGGTVDIDLWADPTGSQATSHCARIGLLTPRSVLLRQVRLAPGNHSIAVNIANELTYPPTQQDQNNMTWNGRDDSSSRRLLIGGMWELNLRAFVNGKRICPTTSKSFWVQWPHMHSYGVVKTLFDVPHFYGADDASSLLSVADDGSRYLPVVMRNQTATGALAALTDNDALMLYSGHSSPGMFFFIPSGPPTEFTFPLATPPPAVTPIGPNAATGSAVSVPGLGPVAPRSRIPLTPVPAVGKPFRDVMFVCIQACYLARSAGTPPSQIPHDFVRAGVDYVFAPTDFVYVGRAMQSRSRALTSEMKKTGATIKSAFRAAFVDPATNKPLDGYLIYHLPRNVDREPCLPARYGSATN